MTSPLRPASGHLAILEGRAGWSSENPQGTALKTTRERERPMLRIYFALTALGLIFSALCGAALSWDGSGYLFETLDKQVPFMVHLRPVSVPLEIPVVVASHITDNLTVLQAVFGLAYAAVPLVALLASWWVVRERAPHLFVWTALGIGLGMLPGQFCFTAEANVALQLFWPVLLALLTRVQRAHVPLILILTIAVLASHPYAIILFGLAIVVALVVASLDKDERVKMQWWAAIFSVAALAGYIIYRSSSYDTQQVSSGGLRWSFTISTAGLPTVALALGALAAVAIFAAPMAAARHAAVTSILHGVAILSLGVAALALVLWARDVHLWQWGNKFTYPALAATLCVMCLAVIETYLQATAKFEGGLTATRDWPYRLKVVQITALVFSAVLCVQSVSWFALTGRLRETLNQSIWSCVSSAPLGWLQHTPLNQFDTPDESLLIQGRTPQKVLLSNNGCTDTTLQSGLPLTQYQIRSWQGGWFNVLPLQHQVAVEQSALQGCTYMLTSGWYSTETDGPHWWRWNDGTDARFRFLMDHTTTVVLNGQMQTVRTPDTVNVLVNGKRIASIAIGWKGLAPILPLTLSLKRGDNMVQFISQNQAEPIAGRALATEVANLTAVATNPVQVCTLRP